MRMKAGLFGVLLAALLILTGLKVDAAPGTDWNSNTVSAVGTGVPPANTRGAQARILARRAAIADAQRQLAEAVHGVQVDAETTVEQMAVTSDIVRTRVSATLRGAKIVSENVTPDGGYEVTMELPMFGSGSIAQAVLPQQTEVIPFPTPQEVVVEPSNPSVQVTVTTQGGYTGVIVDCRGFGLNPVMSPVIKDVSGVKLYGHQNLDYDMVIRDGMASYANDMSQATRAGSNPLVIKAERLDDHNANPVISVTDGNKMLLENNSSGFLSRTAVVFLY